MKIETCIFVQKHSDTNVINLDKRKQLGIKTIMKISNEQNDYENYSKQALIYSMQKSYTYKPNLLA